MDLTADERLSDSPFVDRIWRNHSQEGHPFTSISNAHWSMVVTTIDGKSTLTVRGPETKPTPAYVPPNAEFFGIQFKLGTLMPYMPPKRVMDRQDINLPISSRRKFWLNGASWQFPDYENVDTFIEWLVRGDTLIYDPLVADILRGEPAVMSLRTVQRRFLQATGLTHGTVAQIERARYAAILLKEGTSILDTVDKVGYADQPHLTRSLKRFIGLTPAQLSAEDREEALSFLFKTLPF